jgi:hypothetical protein
MYGSLVSVQVMAGVAVNEGNAVIKQFGDALGPEGRASMEDGFELHCSYGEKNEIKLFRK